MEDQELEDVEIIDDEDSEEIEDISEEEPNPVGRPKGTPASLSQKLAVSKAAKEYQEKLKLGLIEKDPWETHGAYSFMKNGRISKNKKHLVKFVYEERQRWLEDLGGEENLNNIEISMIDEACRLLLFCTLINEHLLSNKKSDILYKEEATGNIKMHSAISTNYLSFTRTYVAILKELQKMTTSRSSSKKRSQKKDFATKIQDLYSRDEK